MAILGPRWLAVCDAAGCKHGMRKGEEYTETLTAPDTGHAIETAKLHGWDTKVGMLCPFCKEESEIRVTEMSDESNGLIDQKENK